MSSTVVKDCTPVRTGDNALIIVVGEDGSLSVDPDTLNNILMNKGGSSEVSIVRMSTDEEDNNTVNATLDTFINNSSNDLNLEIEPNSPTKELTIDIDEVTLRLRHSVNMDHCYTSFSPTPSPNNEPISNLQTTKPLNKSTEDLMAVLSEVDTVSASPVVPATKATEPLIQTLPSNKSTPKTNVPVTTTLQPLNKNVTNKKTLKIVTVTKSVTGMRMTTTQTHVTKPTVPVPAARTTELAKTNEPIDQLETSLNKKKDDEELSELSSESDYAEEDDSADSDFETGRNKVHKPKYRTFASRKHRSNSNSRGRNDKAKTQPGRIAAKPRKSVTKVEEKPVPKLVKPKPSRSRLSTSDKEEPSVHAEPIQSDEAKKIAKKKVTKSATETFDDGIALFSTPDVIRRVSTSGRTDSIDSPTKDVKLQRSTSMEQKMDLIFDSKQDEHLNKRTNNIHSELNTNDDVEKNLKTVESKLLDNVDASCLENSDQNLANLDLDLNTEELLPDELLFQVAKLVENADIQKVIDTNLTLVDQSLDSMLKKNPNEDITDSDNQDFNKLLDNPAPSIQPLNTTSSLDQSPNTNNSFSNTNLINKNTTNKPMQVVRPDGRVIIIPPIEKPATRSSKKKQVPVPSSTPNVVQVEPKIAQPQPKIPPSPSTVLTPKPNNLDNDKRPEMNAVEAVPPPFNAEDDIDSDSDESWKSEDDPDRLWCICKQPHNNRFMICCDTCEEWFHGQCVGVTKALGRYMEQQGKEWQCPNCEKNKKTALQQALNDAQADITTPKAQVETGPRCITCKGPSRNESAYCSEKCIVLHSNKVVVYEKATGTCLTGPNAPSPDNLKQWLKQHPGYEVVSNTNKVLPQSKTPTSKPNKAQVTNSKPIILNKQLGEHGNKIYIQKTLSAQSFYGKPTPATSQKSSPKPQQQLPKTKLVQPHTIVVKATIPKPKTPTQPVPKLNMSQEQTPKPKPPTNRTPSNQKTPRGKSTPSESDKSSPASNTKAPEQLRENVRKTLTEHFNIRLKEQTEIKMTEDEVKTLSNEIELQLYLLFNKDTGAKYRNRYRSLIFNIKDTKNTTLWRRICQKVVSPKELVRLSPDELASQELAQWREREAKHQLDIIKKSELDMLNCARTYLLKSHKGEEVIEKRATIDSTIVADLDKSLTEDDLVDSTSEQTRSKTSTSHEVSKSSTEEKHRKDSSSSRHKSKHDDKSRDRSRKHRDSSKDRKRRSRSRDRRRDDSKESRNSDAKRKRRSRSGSQHKSTDSDKKHKDRHDRSKHKSSSSRHSRHSRHKEESDIASSSASKNKDKSDSSDLLITTLDKKSKEILESLVDNKVVPPLDDKLITALEEPHQPPDSESDHEPSSTVTIATPPRSSETDLEKSISNLPLPVAGASPVSDTSNISDSSIKKVDNSSGKVSPSVPITSANGPTVWKGFVNMIDVTRFKITAQEVSGECASLTTELPTTLDIVGRISPDTVWDYLGKMRRSTAKFISIIRLTADGPEEQGAYQTLYAYLSSRKRFGVVKTANTTIKDFYIMPQASYNPLPQVLLPINGPGFEEARPHLLLGILVSSKRKRSHGFEATPVVSSKRVKESPPRSYTPPPSSGPRDPRLSRLPSSIIMPPLPTPSSDLVKPVPPVDDMDEPYSPGDSDDALPNIPVNIISSSKPVKKPLVEPAEVNQSLAILEPFKTSNFSSIPGLDSAAPISETDVTGTLGVSNLLSALRSTSSGGTLNVTTGSDLNTTDLEALQRNIDEINQRIERERKEIDNISQGIVQHKDDLESSCLANIALPSNLQQILDSIKTKQPSPSNSREASPSQIEEYTPTTRSATPPKLNAGKNEEDVDGSLSTIPLLLPKKTRVAESSSTTNSDFTIPLNLPFGRRNSNLSPGLKRTSDVFETDPKKNSSQSFKTTEMSKITSHFPMISKKAIPFTKKVFNAAQSVIEIDSDLKDESISRSVFSSDEETDTKKNDSTDVEFSESKSKDGEPSPSKGSSVLSSLSAEELIRKANEMLASQDDEKEAEEEEEEAEEEKSIDDDEPYDPESSQILLPVAPKVTSIKQAPVLYPNISVPPPTMRFIPDVDQPPIPGIQQKHQSTTEEDSSCMDCSTSSRTRKVDL